MTANEEEIADVLERLGAADPKIRARTLAGLASRPIPDRRVLTAAERSLEDVAICVLALPYRFGEVRWVGADAVAALRAALSIAEPVKVESVFAPHSTDDVARLAAAAGIEFRRGGIDGVLEVLEVLRTMNKLPRRTITRDPGDYAIAGT